MIFVCFLVSWGTLFVSLHQMSIEDFTMYGGAFGNKQDTAFPNLEVRRNELRPSL